MTETMATRVAPPAARADLFASTPIIDMRLRAQQEPLFDANMFGDFDGI
jgi:hypothetical protein